MARGRSTKIISMIKWIRTSRLSIKNSLSLKGHLGPKGEVVPQELHDERGVLVRLFAQRVEVRDRVVKRLQVKFKNNYFAKMCSCSEEGS